MFSFLTILGSTALGSAALGSTALGSAALGSTALGRTALGWTALTTKCPPPGFDSLSKFRLSAYISRSWYVQEQVPISYQPVDRLFCVRADYSLNENGSINVLNQANSVAKDDRSIAKLSAVIPDADDPSKLAVGPTFLPSFLYGPYWVVAASPTYNDNDEVVDYEWAIVTGGQPTLETDSGKCIGQRAGFLPRIGAGEGFWIFTRDSEVAEELIQEIRNQADQLGLDTSLLVKVDQTDCVYAEEQAPSTGARLLR